MVNVFTYGTLMDPEIMATVSGAAHRSERATLVDYVRKILEGEVYPAIIRREGARVGGIVYFDVTPKAVDRLDAFEGPIYVRTDVVAIGYDEGPIPCHTYVLKASCADRLSNDDWSFETFLKRRKNVFQRTYRGFQTLD